MVASLKLASEPVTRKSGAILKTPISRPDWMLHNDDVELQLKIDSVRISASNFAIVSPIIFICGMTVYF